MPFLKPTLPTYTSSKRARQTEVLGNLINRHLPEKEYLDTFQSPEGSVTTTERGVQRWEHDHLVASLDVLCNYQIIVKARASRWWSLPGAQRRYRNDPRTRFVELLKLWLRAQANNSNIREDDVRRVVLLCRDVIYNGEAFTARHPWSFLHSLEVVYGHLQKQLRDVLARDRSCVALVDEALGRAKNLLSDAVTFLLTGPTDLKQTDSVPSTEVVSLWLALPPELQKKLPNRPDDQLQKMTKDVWKSDCGAVVAALLVPPGARRLFGGRAAGGGQGVAIGATKAIADAPDEDHEDLVTPAVLKARQNFEGKKFKGSGLAGPFRKPDWQQAWEAYLEASICVYNLMFLLGTVFTQFHGVGDCLGDYGMIRLSNWLHPFLAVLEQRVKQLKACLETISACVEEALVLSKARGAKVEGPVPTPGMKKRAYQAIDRAILANDNHIQALLLVLEKLRARSDPERLPKLEEDLKNVYLQLQETLTSPEFRAHIGDASFEEFHRLGGPAGGPRPRGGLLQLGAPDHEALEGSQVEIVSEHDATPVGRGTAGAERKALLDAPAGQGSPGDGGCGSDGGANPFEASELPSQPPLLSGGPSELARSGFAPEQLGEGEDRVKSPEPSDGGGSAVSAPGDASVAKAAGSPGFLSFFRGRAASVPGCRDSP